eukprot:m.15397 g.15397  ORF g.15397 m.15397 type:complete len:330 (-) comp4906_c0_seq1:204-1193(-)
MRGRVSLQAIVAGLWAAGWTSLGSAQTKTPCDWYDVNTGMGSCNNTAVSIGALLCVDGFDPSRCKAPWVYMSDNGPKNVTFYFKGTATGLPTGPTVQSSIQSDCNISEFAQGGIAVAMASVWGNGTLDECEPVAIVKDTQLQYSILPDGNIHTLFLGFNVYTDWRGNQFSAFFQIDCFKGGPTSKFTYTSIGDEGHQSIFQINTQADCTATAAPTPHTTPHPTAVPTRHPVATHHPTHSPTCPPPGPTQCSCPSPSPSAPITRGSAHDVSTVTLSAGALAAIVLAVAIGCFVLGIVCHAPVRRLFDSTGPQRGTQNSGQLVSNQSAMYE